MFIELILSQTITLMFYLLVGCTVIASLKAGSFAPRQGITMFMKILKWVFQFLWYRPAKEELDGSSEGDNEDTGFQVGQYSFIDINDREREFICNGRVVLQFTRKAWEQLRGLERQFQHQGFNDVGQYILEEFPKGVWCVFFDQDQDGNSGEYIQILSDKVVLHCVLQGEGLIHSKLLVTATIQTRGRRNRQVDQFLSNGVFVKCDWKYHKPTPTGEKPPVIISNFSKELVQQVAVRQSLHDNLLAYKELVQIEHEEVKAWKSYVDIAQQVEEESIKNTQQFYKGWKPVADHAIEGDVFRFNLDSKDVSFKPKDMVGIFDSSSAVRSLFKGTVRESGFGYVDLRIDDSLGDNKIPERGCLRLEVSTRPFQIQMEAIDNLLQRDVPNPHLVEILHDPLKAEEPQEVDVEFKNLYIGKNEAQTKAVKQSLGSKDLYIIQGPPGTGKTSVISEIVEHLVERRERVLITSQTNLAVDNVFEKVGNKPDITAIRCGKEEKLLDSVVKYKLENMASSLQKSIKEKTDEAKSVYEQHKYNLTQYLPLLEIVKSKLAYIEEREKRLTDIKQDINSLISSAKVPAGKQFRKLKRKYTIQAWLRDKAILTKEKAAEGFENYNSRKGRKGVLMFGVMALLKVTEKALNRAGMKLDVVLDRNNILMEQARRDTENEIQGDARYIELQEKLASTINEIADTKTNLAQIEGDFPEEIKKIIDFNSSQQLENQLKDMASLEKVLTQRVSIIEEWNEYLKTDEKSLHKLLMDNVDVVGATCIGLETDPNLEGIDFDVAIIDEASRATVPETLVPMARAEKTILVGDHLQLPPTIKREVAEKCDEDEEFDLPYQKSLFELLIDQVNETNKVMLTHQFRMHPDISNFISDAFYNGRYIAGAGTEEKVFPSAVFDESLCFIDTRNYKNKGERKIPNAGFENEVEAILVIKAVKQIIIDYMEQHPGTKEVLDIGIIAPYKKQKELIMAKAKRLNYDRSVVDLEIETLDAFQGREKDVILFSFTRSNRYGNLGFSSELYRINVGLSRARKLMILIGDSETLRKARDQKANPILNNLLDYILKEGKFNILWTDEVHSEAAASKEE